MLDYEIMQTDEDLCLDIDDWVFGFLKESLHPLNSWYEI